MHIEGLDEIDNHILDIIKDNARLTYKEIGDQVGISRVSVKNRMDTLKEKGIIKGYQTVIDPTALPDGIKFFLDVETTPDYFEEAVAILADSKMIRKIYAVSGSCRIHAEGYAPNNRQLEYFAGHLYRGSRGILRIGFYTVLSTLKDMDGGVEYVRYKTSEHLERGTDTRR